MQPMHETWETLLRNAARRYAIGEEAAMLLVLLAAGLAFLAVAIGSHAFFKGRGKTVSLRRAASHLVGFVWVLPVIGVLLMLIVPVVVYFRMESARDRALELEHRAAAEQARAAREMLQRKQAERREGGGAERSSESRPSNLPDWVRAGETGEGDIRLVVVSGQQYSETSRARRDALDEAVQLVKGDFEKRRALRSDWRLPAALVRRHAVRKEYVEPITRSTARNPFLVYRAHYLVELSPQVRVAVYDSWREQVVERRVWILAALLAFVTLMLGTATTYLRLDTMTGGGYRRRLKLASVSLVVAGGLGLALLLPV